MKYHNIACEVNGEKYRSQREMKRHQDLLLLQKAGEIAGLTREVTFVLAPAVELDGKTKRVLRYVADFVYSKKTGQQVIEDCKGFRTAVYQVKRHLMKSVHNIEVFES